MKEILGRIARWALGPIIPLLTRPLRLKALDSITPENVRIHTKDILDAVDSVGVHALAPALARVTLMLAVMVSEDTKAQDKAMRALRLALSALEKKADKPAKKAADNDE
jgi:hypothetical protein